MSHKEEHPLDVRKASSASIRAKHPDRIPVIVEKRQRDVAADIDKKFLVPSDLTVGQFVYVIRKRIKLAPEQAIFLFVSSRHAAADRRAAATVRRHAAAPPPRRAAHAAPPLAARRAAAARISHRSPRARSQVYDQHKDEDGFLYMTYSGENTFGEDDTFGC